MYGASQTMYGASQSMYGASQATYGASQMGTMMGRAASPFGTPLTQQVGYEFTISNGQVTGMEWTNGWRSVDLRLPANASFSVGANAPRTPATQASTTSTRKR